MKPAIKSTPIKLSANGGTPDKPNGTSKLTGSSNSKKVQYRIAGFFPEVLIFPNFPNELLAQENLFWTADCSKRVDCAIMNISIV